MSNAKKLLNKLNEMAFSKSDWESRIRNKLSGTIGEYTKSYIAKQLGETDYWDSEVRSLINGVKELYTSKTKQNFDKVKAFKTVLKEASLSQDQVVSAKNQMINYAPENKTRRVKIHKMVINASDMLNNIESQYLKGFPNE